MKMWMDTGKVGKEREGKEQRKVENKKPRRRVNGQRIENREDPEDGMKERRNEEGRR